MHIDSLPYHSIQYPAMSVCAGSALSLSLSTDIRCASPCCGHLL